MANIVMWLNEKKRSIIVLTALIAFVIGVPLYFPLLLLVAIFFSLFHVYEYIGNNFVWGAIVLISAALDICLVAFCISLILHMMWEVLKNNRILTNNSIIKDKKEEK